MTDPTRPLVSVVIPTYNYGHYVGEAVDSALAQTYSPVEVVVVDDGSTDDTPARLAVYGDRIRVIRQPNAGLSAARNTGIAAARGDLIALLDSDDRFHPRKLEWQAAYLAAHPAVGLLGTAAGSDPAAPWPAVDAPPAGRRLTREELVMKARFSPSSAVVRAAVAAATGPFDTTLKSVEDRDYWIRAAAHAEVHTLDAPLTYYRVMPGSMSRNPERMEAFERVVLDKAFAAPDLRSRRGLKCRARGLAAYSAAWVYLDSGRPAAGLRRAAASLLWWPFGYGRDDVRVPFGRVRLLAACARKALAGGGT